MRHVVTWLMPAFWLVQVVASVSGANADDRSFPYEAVVQADGVQVRSGNGSKFYVTAKLKRGDRVTVIRHDPGGWFVIEPPTGSFSLIPEQNVTRSPVDPARGVVVNPTGKPVAVRVGSAVSNDIAVMQRQLVPGDEVEVLGERVLPADKGTVQKWLVIKPPAREYRWITGQSVVAASQLEKAVVVSSFDRPAQRRSIEPSPKSNVVLQVNGTYDEPKPATKPQKPAQRSTGDTWNLNGLTPEELAAERAAFEELERRYLAIKELPSNRWDFGTLPDEYLELRDHVRHPAIQRKIELRLQNIIADERFRDANADFERITNAAAQREAQLAALQERHENTLRSLPVFDGAGIVQLAAGATPQAPRYVLLAPDGKVLAQLQPEPGVDLAPWVGREAGLTGKRSHQPALGTDVIQIQRLTPVKLQR